MTLPTEQTTFNSSSGCSRTVTQTWDEKIPRNYFTFQLTCRFEKGPVVKFDSKIILIPLPFFHKISDQPHTQRGPCFYIIKYLFVIGILEIKSTYSSSSIFHVEPKRTQVK